MIPLNVPRGSVQSPLGIFLGGCDGLPSWQMKGAFGPARTRVGTGSICRPQGVEDTVTITVTYFVNSSVARFYNGTLDMRSNVGNKLNAVA